MAKSNGGILAGQVKSLILVTSGRGSYAQSGLLDQLLSDLSSQGKNPIVVLGPDGDDFLRSCDKLEACDIVFDPNFEGEVFSSIKAGLEAVSGPTFVAPLETCAGQIDFGVWDKLESSYLANGEASHCHVIQGHRPDGTPLFPLLITAKGLLPSKALPANSDWLASGKLLIHKLIIAEEP